MSLLERIPPQNLEAEQATLGAMLLERDAIRESLLTLRAEDFYSPQHRILFGCICKLYGESTPVDLVTMQAALQEGGQLEAAGGTKYLISLQESAPTAAAIAHYAGIVLEASQRRQLITLASELRTSAQDGSGAPEGLCERVQTRILAIANRRPRAWEKIGDVATRVMYEIEQQAHSDRHLLGIPTGLSCLDRWLAGWCPATYYVIAARPSMGKTSFVLQAAVHAAQQGRGAAFFSLEMHSEGLLRRYLARAIRRELGMVIRAYLRDGDFDQIVAAVSEAQKLPLWLCDQGGLRVEQVAAMARQLATREKISLLVLDYVQLVAGSDDNEEVTRTSHALRALTNELGVSLLAVSQLSRESERAGRRPRLSDLRGSGSLEQDADVVMFLHRPWPHDGPDNARELLLDKQRQGPTGIADLYWSAEQQFFADMAEQPEVSAKERE